jgi:cyanophycinase
MLLICLFVSMIGVNGGNTFAEASGESGSHWAAAEIKKWTEAGWVKGYGDGSFQPDQPIKRAELAAIINRAFRYQATVEPAFTDVKKDAWYWREIGIAVSEGYFAGYPDGTFRPEKPISRAEAAVVIARLLKLDLSSWDQQGADTFSDFSDIPLWSRSAVAALVSKGIVLGGSEGSFHPGTSLTRAQSIVMLERTGQVPAPGEASPSPTPEATASPTPTPSTGTPAPSPSSAPTSTPAPTSTSTPTTDYELTDVTLTKASGVSGTEINHYRLGFMPSVVTDGVDSYLMFFSAQDKSAVTAYLNGISRTQLLEGFLTSGSTGENVNKMYRITNLSYADGGANTFRSGQKDLLTGAALSSGEYYAYAATLGDSGVLGIAAAPQKIVVNIPLYPKDIVLSGDGTAMDPYTVTFADAQNASVLNYFVFYSQKGLVSEVEAMLTETTPETLQQWAEEHKGILLPAGQVTYEASLDETLHQLDGTPDEGGQYFVYAAAVAASGVKGIVKAEEMMVTAPMPVPLTSIGDGPGKGTLLPGGGSTSASPYKAANSPYFQALREATGLPAEERPRLAVFTPGVADTVYDNFYYYGDYSLQQEYADYGFEAVFIPLAVDNYEHYANSEYWANVVKSCEAVFLQGGDQARHARQLLNDDGSLSLIAQAIQYVYDQGGVVGGTSAGAHIQSNPVFGFGDSYPSLVYNDTESVDINDIPVNSLLDPVLSGNNMMTAGLGLLNENIIYDTHFDARGRLGRLLIGLRDTDAELGIGLDEGTGLLIREGVATVVGHNGVYLVSKAGATIEGSSSEEPFQGDGFTLHYLTEGDSYEFSTGAVTPAAGKTLIDSPAGSLYENSDIFSRGSEKYQTTKTILSLMNSAQSSVSASAQKHGVSGGPELMMTFSKDAATEGYASASGYTTGNNAAVNALAGYKKTTVIGLKAAITSGLPAEPGVSAVLVESVLHYSYQDEMYVTFSMGIDPATVTQTNFSLTGNEYYVDEPPYPSYLSDSFEVQIRGESDFEDGDTLTISNVKDLNGDLIPDQVWVKAEGVWVKQ